MVDNYHNITNFRHEHLILLLQWHNEPIDNGLGPAVFSTLAMGLKLKFGRGNAKLSNKIYTFSLPAGHSCPGALKCFAKADQQTGKLQDGTSQAFRCFAAGDESRYPNVRRMRWHNLDALMGKSREEMATLILESLPTDAKIVRLHVSGDFFSEAYFLAWMDVAKAKPDILFYTYTKSLLTWLRHRLSVRANFKLTASEGGKHDALIQSESLKFAKVVFSFEEAQALGLEIDHDDSHAYASDQSFALLLHGNQRTETPAAKAMSTLRSGGHYGYSRNPRRK
jgi:Gene product 88